MKLLKTFLNWICSKFKCEDDYPEIVEDMYVNPKRDDD